MKVWGTQPGQEPQPVEAPVARKGSTDGNTEEGSRQTHCGPVTRHGHGPERSLLIITM